MYSAFNASRYSTRNALSRPAAAQTAASERDCRPEPLLAGVVLDGGEVALALDVIVEVSVEVEVSVGVEMGVETGAVVVLALPPAGVIALRKVKTCSGSY